MSLRFILGRSGAGKTYQCLDEIRARLQLQPEGCPLVLILPEHATFQTEQMLAATPGLGGFTRASVFGFRRLAQRILLETGGAIRPHINELGKHLILGRLLRQNSQQLKVLGRAAGQRNFTEALAGIIREFKNCLVMPADLQQISPVIGNAALHDKLEDLALLYSQFNEFLEGRYTDPEDCLKLLVDKIPEAALLQQAEVWIDGFSWFNPQELVIVSSLMQTAASVTVTLCLAQPGSGVHQDESAVFHRQWNTWRKLKSLAGSMGLAVQEMELTETARFHHAPLIAHIERHFFNFPVQLYTGSDGRDLEIVEAANRRLEVEGAAAAMIDLCRQDGYRWRDMAVLFRDAEQYYDLVSIVLADFDIPFFSDGKRQAIHHPLAELIRSALESVDGWRYEPLFRCFKTDLFPLTRDQVDILENYVLQFGIRGSRWTQPEQWTFVRRLSLGEDEAVDDNQQQYLDDINDIRIAAIAPLQIFEGCIKQADTAIEMAACMYQFLETLNVPAQLEAWAAAAEQQGDLVQAREHRQIWEGIIHLLEQLAETCGDQQISRSEFAAMIEDGLDSLKLSLIPPGLDYVTVATIEQSSIANIKAVFLLGVNDGVLPKRGRNEGLLNDDERNLLAGVGVELAPGAAAGHFAERFLIYTALTRSTHFLWLSYPLADAEGNGLDCSDVVSRIQEMTGRATVKRLTIEAAPGDEQHLLAHPRRALAALAGCLRQYKNGGEISPVWWDVYNWMLADEAYRRPLQQVTAGLFQVNAVQRLPPRLASQLYAANQRLRGSVTRFESFRSCRFKHFIQYGLKLKERAVFQLKAPDLGQFLHAALKEFGERIKADGRSWGSLSEDESTAVCAQIIDDLAPKLQNEILLSSAQYQHLLGRLRQTVGCSVRRLMAFDRASKFKPLAFEQNFGQGSGALPPLRYRLAGGYYLELAGQIDRIDQALYNGRPCILIIDYKSGGSWLKLIDVYYGLKLQLLTYLLVVQKSAERLFGIPDSLAAGVLYYFLKNPNVVASGKLDEQALQKAVNQQLKMPGWVLADEQVIRLLDSSIESKSEFLKIAFKKDNTFHSASLPYVKTEQQFTLLLEHIEALLTETGQQILDGHIEIDPCVLNNYQACSYCRYLAVCQFDALLPENEYRSLTDMPDHTVLQILAKGGKV